MRCINVSGGIGRLSPKSEVRRKAEIRIPNAPTPSPLRQESARGHCGLALPLWGRYPKAPHSTTAARLIRVSDFGLLSDFGFRISEFACRPLAD